MSKFQKGQSGNPSGRPKGALGMAGRLRAAIQGDAEQIIQSLITQAKGGDTAAAKLLLDRVCPALKPEAQAVDLEQLATGSLIEKAEAVLSAAGAGTRFRHRTIASRGFLPIPTPLLRQTAQKCVVDTAVQLPSGVWSQGDRDVMEKNRPSHPRTLTSQCAAPVAPRDDSG